MLAQEIKHSNYFAQIPEYPEDYGPGNVMARLVEGLGFRYYWASIDLKEPDLNYKPSADGRSTLETLQHICAMSHGIREVTTGQEQLKPDLKGMDYEELRFQTLENLKEAAAALRGKTAEELAAMKLGRGSHTFPFWNMINGQISDCLYHTGQVVSYRRSSGNPMPAGVNVFLGTAAER